MQCVGTGAELGDLVYSLPAIRALGLRNVVNIERPWTRPLWLKRSKSLKRLVESQPYIDSFKDYAGEDIIDLTTYRFQGHRFGDTIVQRIARWARVQVNLDEPWLEVDPNLKTKDRIIVARCPRWTTYSWPYKALVKSFGKDMLFIGTDDEYKSFCAEFGFITRFPCNDLLDVAQAIKGSALFIGNQSAPNAICEGLKHPSVLEVCPTSLDCWFDRSNTVYSVDGEMNFSALGKTFQSEAIVQPYCFPAGSKIAYGRTPFECEMVARVLFALQKLSIPALKDIQYQMIQRKAA